MRRIAIGFMAVALIAMATAPSYSAVLMSEGFAYANGNLVPNGGWANHSGVGTDIQVTAGRAIVDMLQAPDDNKAFAAQGTTGKTYYCLEVLIPAISGAPRLNYFAHLKDTGTINFVGRLGVAPSGTGFTLAVGASAFTTPTNWTSQLAYDTNYRVVVSYDAAAGAHRDRLSIRSDRLVRHVGEPGQRAEPEGHERGHGRDQCLGVRAAGEQHGHGHGVEGLGGQRRRGQHVRRSVLPDYSHAFGHLGSAEAALPLNA